jgi:mRNA interferase RelE/StbE
MKRGRILVWKIDVSDSAYKQLGKLDKQIARRIFSVLDRISLLEDPRSIGEALKGSELGDFWKYRIGDWRLICKIEDDRVVVTLIRLGHRGEVYK